MTGTGKKHLKLIPLLFVFVISIVVLFSLHSPLSAKVTGSCANCHTMHNSQNGTAVVAGGPKKELLKSDCIGCHSSSTTQTMITSNGTTYPIVYNTGGTGGNPALAGGNFYWVTQDQTKGHNVYGIAAQDTLLAQAPGRNMSACNADACHVTLAAVPNGNYDRGGCQGCHVFTYHHTDNGVYRFLKGHGFPPAFPSLPQSHADITNPLYADYVTGTEDNDWEFETTVDHNYYKGYTGGYTSDGTGLRTAHSISAFCSGCHRTFHEEMGTSSPWLRHPIDILLPNANEYASYTYRNDSPAAFLNPPASATGPMPPRAEAVVMCLSCHRAHASDQPDILRFNYSTMIAMGGNTAGCLNCHSGKRN